jgi:hypothetical protein
LAAFQMLQNIRGDRLAVVIARGTVGVGVAAAVAEERIPPESKCLLGRWHYVGQTR